jgi:uncharacterized protein YegL
MCGEKFGAAKAAVQDAIHLLADPQNRNAFVVSIVVFSDGAAVLTEPRDCADFDSESVFARCHPSGTTNIAVALDLARTTLSTAPTEQLWLRPVGVLLSDGGHNATSSLSAAAMAFKSTADLVAVAYGSDANLAELRVTATSPDHAVQVASAQDLKRFFMTVAASVSRAALNGQPAISLLGNALLRG